MTCVEIADADKSGLETHAITSMAGPAALYGRNTDGPARRQETDQTGYRVIDFLILCVYKDDCTQLREMELMMTRDEQILDYLTTSFRAIFPLSECRVFQNDDPDALTAMVQFDTVRVHTFDCYIDFDDETHYTFILRDTLIEIRIPFLP